MRRAPPAPAGGHARHQQHGVHDPRGGGDRVLRREQLVVQLHAPHGAGDDGDGEQREAEDDAAAVERVERLERGAALEEAPGAMRLERALLDEVDDRAAGGDGEQRHAGGGQRDVHGAERRHAAHRLVRRRQARREVEHHRHRHDQRADHRHAHAQRRREVGAADEPGGERQRLARVHRRMQPVRAQPADVERLRGERRRERAARPRAPGPREPAMRCAR